MKKKQFTWFIIIIIFLLVLTSALYFIIRTTAVDRTLNNTPNESDYDPAYIGYGVLYVNNQKLDISSMCRKQDKSLMEVVCIFEDDVYFVYGASGDWVIASIDLQTKLWTDHYRFTHAENTYYTLQHDCAYSERNGFYYDGQVYLNDFESVLIYNISSGQTCLSDFGSAAFPELPAVYSASLGEHSFKLHIGEDAYSFELNDVAQNSNGISALNALKDKVIWDGKTSCLHNFFEELDIQVIGDRIYAQEPVLNFYGETYAVILEYNADTGTWLYIGSYCTGDIIARNCYIIPEDR